jgi:hypothetical protein
MALASTGRRRRQPTGSLFLAGAQLSLVVGSNKITTSFDGGVNPVDRAFAGAVATYRRG